MLSFAAAAEFNSRLACQIAMREEFNGLTVRVCRRASTDTKGAIG